MIGLKGTLIAGTLGVVVALGFAYKWKSEQVKVAQLQGELTQALTNTETLKTALAEQTAVVGKMIALVATNQEQLNELTQKLEAANTETAKARARVEILRASEANRALAAPFERGNAARGRFSDSLQRISPQTGGESPDSNNTDATGSRDTPETGAP